MKQPALEASRFLILLSESINKIFKPVDFFGETGFSVRYITTETEGYSSADSVEMYLDFRTGAVISEETFVNSIREFINQQIIDSKLLLSERNFQLIIPDRGIPYFPAFLADEENPHVDFSLKVFEEFFGVLPERRINLSVADANVFALLAPEIPVFTFGPTGGEAHSFKEWLQKDATEVATEYYKILIKAFDSEFNE